MAGLLIPAAGPDDVVSATVRAWSAEPFSWGRTDCGLSVLGYVERVTGRLARPAPDYADRRSAVEMLRAKGGMEAYCAAIMVGLGCPPTDAPQRGDVGLVKLPGSGLTACLCLGDLWAARGDREIVLARMTPISAWRVACRKP